MAVVTDRLRLPTELAHRMVRWADLANALTGRNDPLPIVRFAEDRLPAAAELASPAVVLHPFSAIPERGPGVGTPTLCLASAAHVIDSVPYDPRMTPDNVTFLYHDMPCRGCLGTCIHDLEGGVYPCVARLDPGIVTGKVRDLLTARRGDGVS